MADFVLDEWLWADLADEAHPEKQRESFQFLEAVFRKCDRLVIVKGSKFARKADGFWKHTDLRRRSIARFFRDEFLYNALKSVSLDEAELEALFSEIAEAVKDDDHYLVRAFLTCRAAGIVSTDGPLIQQLENHRIACFHRDQFVRDYIERHGRA